MVSNRISKTGDPYKWHAIAFALLVGLTAPLIILLLMVTQLTPVRDVSSLQIQQIAQELGLDADAIYRGAYIYSKSCALCHGNDANGVARLGKPLRNSAFVQQHSDDKLFTLIAQGRLPSDPANTTGAAMPARGNQALNDDDLRSVVQYLRSIQDMDQPTVSVDAWNIPRDMSSETAGLSGVGHDIFVASCSACHGPQGQGMEGLGKPLATSEFVVAQSDEELIKFIKSGRPIWDSNNTTGLDMPPKGGNPALTDEQLSDIVRFIRSIHK